MKILGNLFGKKQPSDAKSITESNVGQSAKKRPDNPNSITESDIEQMGKEKDIPGLIMALGSNKVSIIDRTIEILGKTGDERAIEPLVELIKRKDTNRVTLTVALGNFHDPRVVEPLLEALADEFWFVRNLAAAFLGRIHNIVDERAIEPLVNALSDEREEVRSAVAITLFQVDTSHNILEQGQNLSDDTWLQLAVNRLVVIYLQNPNGFVRGAGDSALRHIGSLINNRGGMDLMLEAHAKFSRKSTIRGSSRNLESIWDRIGDWLG